MAAVNAMTWPLAETARIAQLNAVTLAVAVNQLLEKVADYTIKKFSGNIEQRADYSPTEAQNS